MNKSPAFQFYVNDWLSSTHISLMTPAEEGAYIRLLCYAWNDPDCSIPDNDETLSVLSRLGEGWLKGGSRVVRKCFQPHPTILGKLINIRLLKEKKKQSLWREKSSDGGKKSAKLRNLKEKKQVKGGSRVVQPPYQPKGNSSSSSLSSISSSSISSKKDKKTLTPLPENFTISETIKKWASSKSIYHLEKHLDHFKDTALAKGYKYVDWDAAFRNAIKNDWAKVKDKKREYEYEELT